MMLSDARLVLALEFEAAGLKDSVLDAHLFRLEAVITTANNCCNQMLVSGMLVSGTQVTILSTSTALDKHCSSRLLQRDCLEAN